MSARSFKKSLAMLLCFALVFQFALADFVALVKAAPGDGVVTDLPGKACTVSGDVLQNGSAYTKSISDNDINCFAFGSVDYASAFYIQTENITLTRSITVYRMVADVGPGMTEISSDLSDSQHGCAFPINDHCTFFFAKPGESYFINIDYDAQPDDDPVFCIYPCEIDNSTYQDLVTYENEFWNMRYGAFLTIQADPDDYDMTIEGVCPDDQTVYTSFDGSIFTEATQMDSENNWFCKASGSLKSGNEIMLAIVPNFYHEEGAEALIKICKKEKTVTIPDPVPKTDVGSSDPSPDPTPKPAPKPEVNAKKISFNYKSITLKKGTTFKDLKVIFNPSDTTNKTIKWSSTNKKVVTVDSNGKLTAKKRGSAKITAKTANGKKVSIKVKVDTKTKLVEAPYTCKVKSIKVPEKKISLKKGDVYALKATTDPSKSVRLTYESSNPKIVEVNKKGKLQAKNKGKATIKITANGNKSIKVSVTVK